MSVCPRARLTVLRDVGGDLVAVAVEGFVVLLVPSGRIIATECDVEVVQECVPSRPVLGEVARARTGVDKHARHGIDQFDVDPALLEDGEVAFGVQSVLLR